MQRARWLVGLLVLPTAVALSLGLMVATHWQPLLHADASADRSVQAAAANHDAYAAGLKAVSNVLQPTSWRVAALLLAAWLTWRRRFRPAVYLAAVAVVGGLVSTGLKDLVDRPRPHWADPVLTVGGASWPSGHALAAAAGAASLTLALTLAHQPPRPRNPGRPRRVARPFRRVAGEQVLARPKRPNLGPLGGDGCGGGGGGGSGSGSGGVGVGVGVGLGLLALLVGASRVLLGVHYPSDVVSGWALGLLVAGVLAGALGLAPGVPSPDRTALIRPGRRGGGPSPRHGPR